jgi:hypothetical protein
VPSDCYLVFGDLHGRVLPAFRLALAWQREAGERVRGLLQVGDLGYFPDTSRLDKATLRHALDDPLELGVQDVVHGTAQADAVFAEPDPPEALWFTAGNHEDHEALERLANGGAGGGPRSTEFPVDAYRRVRCLRDGRVTTLAGGLRVGALWGIDDQAPNARRRTPARARIRPRSATELSAAKFDVLLMHESPRDAMSPGSGSSDIDALLELARPAFAFFGHYHRKPRFAPETYAPTQVYHLHGLELRGPGGSAEECSVGVLRWHGGGGEFEYLDPRWLRTVTRQNWAHR